MKVVLFLPLLLCLASNFCKRTKRIVAPECNITEQPSVVSLITPISKTQNTTTYKYGSGILITNKWVLTLSTVSDNENHTPVQIIAGSNFELPADDADVRSVADTDYYKDTDNRDDNKLVLLELDREIEENDRMKPATLPPSRDFIDNCRDLRTAGWGAKSDINDDENKTTTPPGDYLKCGKAKKALCSRENSITFCYDMVDSSKMCSRDIGFGIFCNDTLVGITSRPYYWACSRVGNKAINISHFTKWLHEATGVEVDFEGIPVRYTSSYDSFMLTRKTKKTTKPTKRRLKQTTTIRFDDIIIGRGQRTIGVYSLYISAFVVQAIILIGQW